jgi:hypothetical protein
MVLTIHLQGAALEVEIQHVFYINLPVRPAVVGAPASYIIHLHIRQNRNSKAKMKKKVFF